jgi:hypothetical protein
VPDGVSQIGPKHIGHIKAKLAGKGKTFKQ